jgi:hypothetical protein
MFSRKREVPKTPVEIRRALEWEDVLDRRFDRAGQLVLLCLTVAGSAEMMVALALGHPGPAAGGGFLGAVAGFGRRRR